MGVFSKKSLQLLVFFFYIDTHMITIDLAIPRNIENNKYKTITIA